MFLLVFFSSYWFELQKHESIGIVFPKKGLEKKENESTTVLSAAGFGLAQGPLLAVAHAGEATWAGRSLAERPKHSWAPPPGTRIESY